MVRGKWFVWLAMLAIVAGCGRPAATATPASGTGDALQARIQRVEGGLIGVTPDGEIASQEPLGLAERMAHHGVPGVSIAVINDFEIEWAKGYGFLESGGPAPVTPDTLFHAGSIAKSLSAAAVLHLVAGGRLDLDANVNDALASWHVPENEYTTAEKVTLRRLLSHTAGLEDGFTNRTTADPIPGYFAPAGEAPTVTLQQMLDGAPGVDVDGPTYVARVPGSAYSYANADYAVLELLLVDATGQPFGPLMSETVLQPLGMTSSTYEQPLPAHLHSRAATEHDLNGRPLAGQRLHAPMLAAGGLWTTPSDLARFAIEVMLAYDGRSGRLLSQEMAGEMLAPVIATPDRLLGDAEGLGVNLAGEGPDLRFFHTGGTWGSSAVLWAYPERGQGAVIMSNSAGGQGMLLFEILLSLAVEYDWPMS